MEKLTIIFLNWTYHRNKWRHFQLSIVTVYKHGYWTSLFWIAKVIYYKWLIFQFSLPKAIHARHRTIQPQIFHVAAHRSPTLCPADSPLPAAPGDVARAPPRAGHQWRKPAAEKRQNGLKQPCFCFDMFLWTSFCQFQHIVRWLANHWLFGWPTFWDSINLNLQKMQTSTSTMVYFHGSIFLKSEFSFVIWVEKMTKIDLWNGLRSVTEAVCTAQVLTSEALDKQRFWERNPPQQLEEPYPRGWWGSIFGCLNHADIKGKGCENPFVWFCRQTLSINWIMTKQESIPGCQKTCFWDAAQQNRDQPPPRKSFITSWTIHVRQQLACQEPMYLYIIIHNI